MIITLRSDSKKGAMVFEETQVSIKRIHKVFWNIVKYSRAEKWHLLKKFCTPSIRNIIRERGMVDIIRLHNIKLKKTNKKINRFIKVIINCESNESQQINSLWTFNSKNYKVTEIEDICL